MRKIFFDTQLQNDITSKGYTIVPLLNGEEVQFLLDEFKTLHPDDGFKVIADCSFHLTLMDTNTEYKKRANSIIRQVFLPKLKSLLTYDILMGNFFVKPPGGVGLRAHQNITLLKDVNDTSVSVWCPLVDVNESNGQLFIVEGSHGLTPYIKAATNVEFFHSFSTSLEKLYKPIFLKAGHAMIFDDSLIHGALGNQSSHTRYAVQLSCDPINTKAVYYRYDVDSPDKGFEVFEVDSEFFIRNSAKNYLGGQIRSKSLGFVENHNRLISEEEFNRLMRDRNYIR